MSNGRAGDASTPLDNNRRERFCREYLVDLNATQAAIRAGYSERTAGSQGHRLLKDADVAARVACLQGAIAERTDVTVDWVVDQLREVAERCLEPTPVRDRKGKIVPGEWTMHVSGATQALGLLGKHLGMFVDKHEHTGKDGAPLIPPGRLAPAEIPDRLRALLGRN